jgi:serine protease Do
MDDEKITNENNGALPEDNNNIKPAGGDTFQYHPSMRPSPPPFDFGVVTGTEKNKRRHIFSLRRTLIIIILGVLILGILLFSLTYKVTFGGSADGFSVNIARRNPPKIEGGASLPPEDTRQDSKDFNDNQDSQTPADSSNGNRTWDGSVLDVMPPGGDRQKMDFRQVYREISPSVVGITAHYSTFGGFFGNESGGDSYETYASGTVMTEDGYIITVCSGVMSADKITVEADGASYQAALIGLDYATDLAVLKIDTGGKKLAAAEFVSSEKIAAGDMAAVVGNPVEGVMNLFTGVVSAVNDSFSYKGYGLSVIQVSMNLGSGATGSPLINELGQVIGIIDMAVSDEYPEAGGVCFALSVGALKPVIDELLQHGYVKGRPTSGIAASNVKPSAAVIYGLPEGVVVTGVQAGGNAEKAGVRRNDVIMSANGKKISSTDDLYAVINGMSAGDELTLEIFRDGDTGEITFKLEEANAPKAAGDAVAS